MSVKFLDIAPALPASVAFVYVTSFTNVWNHVLPSWINAEASDVQINCKPQMLDEEAKGQNPTSIPDRKSPLEASSFLLHMGHHSLTTTKFFSDDQSCSINACIGQLGLVVAELAVYYYRTGIWVQNQLILLGACWACMIIRSLWPTLHPVFDELSSHCSNRNRCYTAARLAQGVEAVFCGPEDQRVQHWCVFDKRRGKRATAPTGPHAHL